MIFRCFLCIICKISGILKFDENLMIVHVCYLITSERVNINLSAEINVGNKLLPLLVSCNMFFHFQAFRCVYMPKYVYAVNTKYIWITTPIRYSKSNKFITCTNYTVKNSLLSVFEEFFKISNKRITKESILSADFYAVPYFHGFLHFQVYHKYIIIRSLDTRVVQKVKSYKTTQCAYRGPPSFNHTLTQIIPNSVSE